jgi:hypothetical protein
VYCAPTREGHTPVRATALGSSRGAGANFELVRNGASDGLGRADAIGANLARQCSRCEALREQGGEIDAVLCLIDREAVAAVRVAEAVAAS